MWRHKEESGEEQQEQRMVSAVRDEKKKVREGFVLERSMRGCLWVDEL